MSEFIHLHNHTHYSLLDAISTIDGLVNAAFENKMSAVALTDHGVMYGVMEFYKKAKSKGIKPVVGCEVYVAQSGSRFDKGKKFVKAIEEVEEQNLESSDGLTSTNINYAHLILLAKNETGYRNLIKLISIGHTEGYYYKPRIDVEVLSQYSEGIVATSACAGGVISCYITRDDMKTAEKMTGVYKDIFGEDFYLEIQDHDIPAEKKVIAAMPKLAKKFGLKLIATNDVHYIKKEHAIAHNIYLNISAKQSAKNIRNSVPSDLLTNLRYGTDQIYFKSTKEMCELFRNYPEALKSTLEVTEKCNLELDTSQNFMPNYQIPLEEKVKTFDEYLEKLSHEGLKNRFINVTDEYRSRLKYELDVIKRMNFSGYFLIVKDFIDYAKSIGIIVGPGRGSAAGSLVCYCIGITNVNPLDYNLLFERFLNPERVSMPDIDIDFQDDRRDEVIRYAKEKYGENSVAQVVTFNKLAPRGVLKDVGRVLNFPFQEINDLTKTIPIIFGKVKKLSECMKEEPDFKKYFEDGDNFQKEEKKKLYDYCLVLENLNKNSSIHASGLVIAPGNVTDYVPLSKVTGEDNVFCTQFDMNQLEDAGLIKIDFLGLKELKVLGKTLALINKRYKKNITIDDIPLDDEKTFDLFSAGSTVGIFQFSKSKMRESLAKLKPKNINDLAAMNALYRPGPMKLIPDFIDKRFGRKPITYPHPKMEDTLKETYGIIVYQEQVMQIARDVAGFSLAEADNMRKAMGKKKKEILIKTEEKFIQGAIKNNVSKKVASDIFALIFDFADYGFNKSHGVAYSILAFYTAYLKTHYPLEFLTVSMACRKDDETELQQLANECRKMKIVLRAPDVNESQMDFAIRYSELESEDKVGEILYGLSAIKNVGEKAAQNIIDERIANGKYNGFIDFLKRVDLRLVNKKCVENLVFSGAFDGIDPNRNKLFLNLERSTMYAQRYSSSQEAKGQEGLFGNNENSKVLNQDYIIQDYHEFPETEKYNREKAAIGFYITGHPLSHYEKDIENFIDLTFGEEPSEIDFKKIKTATMCGVINDMQVKISKKGNKFVVFNLVDFYGSGECVAFGRLYESKIKLFSNDNLVIVRGTPEENGDKIKMTVQEIYSIDTFLEIFTKNLTVKLNEKHTDVSKIFSIKDVVEKNIGTSNLFFSVMNSTHSRAFKSKEYKIKATQELISNLKNIVGENNLKLN
ncbi:MAG: DNA polymerase III subunit alpha [Bacteroidota bacterium]|nr:DNA polymerase III subunit alpha [Bacteroidota bacterium]